MARARDLGVVGLALCLAFLSLEWSQNIQISLKWTLPFPTSSFANGHSPNAREILPSPVVTDLEGDGKMEVVVVTPDLLLKVFVWSAQSDTLVLRSEASLLPKSHKVKLGRRPVALGCGYLDPYSGGRTAARQQVIVVLTESWHVLCFDAQLSLLWETTVDVGLEELDSQKTGFWFHREATVLVTSVPIHKGDRGTVVVGGRMVSDESSGAMFRGRTGLHAHAAMPSGSPTLDSEVASAEGHYSFFALAGGTGKERWRHGTHDFYDENEHSGESLGADELPSHSQVLHVLAHVHGKHLGELDWTAFKSAMLRQLPHRWTSPADSRLELGRFEQERRAGRADADVSSNGQSASSSNEWTAAFSHLHTPGLAHGGLSPHSEAEHVSKPNVLVVHAQRGVEVLHFYSGKTLCNMPLLQPPVSLFADVNGDGIVDRVYATQLTHKHHRQSGAGGDDDDDDNSADNALTSRQGLLFIAEPVFEMGQLWNMSLTTTSARYSWASFALNIRQFGRPKSERGGAAPHELSVVPPLAFPSTWRLKPGTEPLHQHGRLYDTLFLLSDGRVIGIRPEDGRTTWSTQTKAVRPASRHAQQQQQAESGDGSPSNRFLMRSIFAADSTATASPAHTNHQSLHSFATTVHGSVDAVLAVGEALVVLAANGRVIADVDLQPFGAPVSAPIIVDFNNDGYADFLYLSNNAYYGFSLVSGQSTAVVPVLLGVLIVLFAAIVFVRSPPVPATRLRKDVVKRGTD